MRAVAVFPARKAVALVDHPDPGRPGSTQARLKILDVGICGTDREICSFLYGEPPPGSDRLVLGHEGLAQVVDAGPDASGVRVGDLVVPSVRRPCPDPACAPCRSGRQDFCASGRFVECGIVRSHGFLAEFVLEESRDLVRLPAGLADVGVLLEPLTIAEKALLQVRAIDGRHPQGARGRNAVVLGAGPVGLLGAMALIASGYRVWVYSRSPAPNLKGSIAEAIGARYVSSSEVSCEGLAGQVGNIDLVYEAVGISAVSFDLLSVLGINGVCVFTGIPPLGAASARDTDLLMRNLVLKNQVVLGTVNAGPDAFATAVRDLAEFDRRWAGPLRSLITGRFPLQEAARLLQGAASGIKSVICVS